MGVSHPLIPVLQPYLADVAMLANQQAAVGSVIVECSQSVYRAHCSR